VTAPRGVQLVDHRPVDRAGFENARPLVRDRDAEQRIAMRVVRRSVQRIDDESLVAGPGVDPALLAQNRGPGKILAYTLDDERFRSPIGIGDQIGPMLVGDLAWMIEPIR
jgi:hypothetical protein